MFLRDMIAVSCCISPFDLNGVLLYQAINLKGLWTEAQGVGNPDRVSIRVFFLEAQFCSVFEKGSCVPVKKSPLVLVNVNEMSFFVCDAQDAINEEVGFIIAFHFLNSLVNSLFDSLRIP